MPNGYFPAVALSKQGEYVVFEKQSGDAQKYGIYFMKKIGGKFTKPKRLSTESYAEVPSIAVRGSLIVVWYQSYDPKTQVYTLCRKESADNGETWK